MKVTIICLLLVQLFVSLGCFVKPVTIKKWGNLYFFIYVCDYFFASNYIKHTDV